MIRYGLRRGRSSGYAHGVGKDLTGDTGGRISRQAAALVFFANQVFQVFAEAHKVALRHEPLGGAHEVAVDGHLDALFHVCGIYTRVLGRQQDIEHQPAHDEE